MAGNKHANRCVCCGSWLMFTWVFALRNRNPNIWGLQSRSVAITLLKTECLSYEPINSVKELKAWNICFSVGTTEWTNRPNGSTYYSRCCCTASTPGLQTGHSERKWRQTDVTNWPISGLYAVYASVTYSSHELIARYYTGEIDSREWNRVYRLTNCTR